MSRASLNLLENTQNASEMSGPPARVDLVQGFGAKRYTVAVHVSNFKGTVFIEASLASEPGEGDWFDATEPFVFSVISDNPDLPQSGVTGAFGRTFTGNFAWMRARMKHPDPIIPYPVNAGSVDRVLVNY